MPQDSMERWVVPMPKQMTSALPGRRARLASGRWAMNLVMGVRVVIPTPFTSSLFSAREAPVATTVAVWSRRIRMGRNCHS